jgi:autotransporter-associated beta strand protein
MRVDLDGASSTMQLGGTVTGAGGFEKINAGTLTLSGSTANDYAGTTIITGGTLNLNKTGGTTAIAGNLTVGSTAKLLVSASNQVADGSGVTLSGGTIERGSGVTETFGNLNLTTASFINFGTGATSSLNFGTYTGGGFKLNVSNFLAGNVLTFKTDLSGSINNSSLFGFDNGFTSDWNGSTFTITAIPEPSTVLAALGLGGLLLWPTVRRLRGKHRRV